jgi:oligopeptide transport system substrate-binding protein
MKKILFVLLALFAVTGLVVAQDFIMSNSSEPTLDPNLMTDTTSTNVYVGIFEGLVQYDPKTSKATPGVAEKWETSKDGLTVTFHLRKNAKWSDGHPVTANDFVNSMKRILDPKTASEYGYFPAMVIKGAEDFNAGKGSFDTVGYVAKDDYTLVVTLKGPAPYAVDMMAHSAFGPIPQWAVDKYGQDWTKPGNIVTNGAYRLKEWKVQEYILLEKDPTYWDAKNVKLKSIKILPIDNDTTNYNMFKAGQLDWQYTVAVSKIDEIKLRKDFQVSPQMATYYVSLNLKRKPFDDLRVRQALAMAVDKKAIVEKITKAGQVPADEMVPNMTGYVGQKGAGYNPEQAKKLLAAAGFPDGKGFPAFTYIYNTNEGHKAIAEYLQSTWKTVLGIDMTLQNMDFKSLLELRDTQRDFTVSRNGWVGDYLDPNTMLELFIKDSGNNCGSYDNPAYDALIEKAKTASGAARMKLLQQAEAILLTKDQAVIPLYHYVNLDMIDTSKWGGWYANPLGFHPFKFIYKK